MIIKFDKNFETLVYIKVLNPKKSEYMTLWSNHPSNGTLEYDNTVLKNTKEKSLPECRHRLKLHRRIKRMSKKANQKLNALSRPSDLLNADMKTETIPCQ